MGSSNHQSKFTCSLHCQLVLILIITLIRTSYYTADASLRNVTKDHFLNVSYQKSPKLTRANNATSSIISPSNTRSDGFHKVSNLQTTSIHPNQTTKIDLILKDESTQKFKRLREDETSRHSYNSSNMNLTNPQEEDIMMTSDSRNYYRTAEDEYDTATEDESSTGVDPSNESYDEASSTLSEQKVVKEITKLISKGMAGATDQMKLDTLENWKRRQKERKVIKDHRAKVFEDILTAAINSHSEKLKKEGKKKKPENKRSNASSTQPPLFSDADTANLDPDLAKDAEIVVRQLQNVASFMDHPSSPNYESESSSLEDDGNRESSDSNETSSTTDGESKTTKKSTIDRPIVRQFKKIKKQISQRRKQLDQIKKMFNIDLSINPKDGSLVGKSTSKKKETSGTQDFGDFTVIDDNTMAADPKVQKRSRKSGKNTKMNDLMLYLKENPEIMASVMSELTTDADPRFSQPSVLQSESGDDTSYDAPSFNHDTMTRKSMGGFQKVPLDIERILLDRARKTTRNIERLNLELAEPMPPALKYQRPQNYDPPSSHNDRRNYTSSIFSSLALPRSPEARLLETLRERQLLNLMKLDMVLAERQQAGSNRSHVVSKPNEPLSSTHKTSDKFENNSHHQNQENKLHEQRQIPQRANHNGSGGNNVLSDEEIVHHYMVTSGDLYSPESRNQNNWKISAMKTPNDQVSKNYDDTISSYHAQYPTDQSTGSKDVYDRTSQRQQPLDRFNNWLDVSRSEASLSNRNDKNMQTNLSWTPYDLTTGGSSSIQHRGTTSLETNSSPRFYQKPNAQLKETELPVFAGINQGIHNPQIKDYGDSIVIQPDHYLTSGSRNPHDELNPSNSIFMTRSSVTHKATGTSTGTDSDTEKDLGYDQNSRISREDKEDTSADEDNSEDIESRSDSDSESPRGVGPVDYFSAYKRQDHLLNAKGIQYRPALKKRRSVSRRVGLKYEAMGGMWA